MNKLSFGNMLKEFTNKNGGYTGLNSYLGNMEGSVDEGMKKLPSEPSGPDSQGQVASLGGDKKNKKSGK